MAKAKRHIAKNPAADAPDDLELEEVLEDLLPRLDDDVFELGVWLEKHFKGKIRLLGDGQPTHPNMFPSHIGVNAWRDPDNRPRIEIEVRRAIDDAPTRWSVERKSYEAYRPDLPSLSSSERKRDEFRNKATAYLVANGLPDPPTAEKLYSVLVEKLGSGQCPGRTIGMEILSPMIREVKAALGI